MLRARQAAYRPVSVGLIGAGKFGTMFSAQIRLTDGMHLVGVADLDVARARKQLQSAGWNPDAISAPSLETADVTGLLHITDDGGGNRHPGGGHPPCAQGDRTRQAC